MKTAPEGVKGFGGDSRLDVATFKCLSSPLASEFEGFAHLRNEILEFATGTIIQKAIAAASRLVCNGSQMKLHIFSAEACTRSSLDKCEGAAPIHEMQLYVIIERMNIE